MIPKIKHIVELKDYVLKITFEDGVIVLYDVKTDMNENPIYEKLKEKNLFSQFKLDTSRTVLYWDDRLDIPSDSIYEYGTKIKE